MTAQPVRTARHGPVLVLTLHRPERRNSMDPSALAALHDQVRAAAADETVRALVLTGEGPAFCTGADLKWLASLERPHEGIMTLVRAHHAIVPELRALPKPIIAAVNGAAAGGGLGFALVADYRIASSTASFTPAYLRLGLTPDGGNSALLARMIGIARATELLLTNRTLTSDEALALGLVSEVVPPERLMERSIEVAMELAEAPGAALARTRFLLDRAFTQPLEAQLAVEAEMMAISSASEDFREGLAAFLAKRRPRFSGQRDE